MSKCSMTAGVLFATAVGLVAGSLMPASAYAYIDPGTGSLVFQWVIAGVVAASFVWKTLAGRVSAVLRRRRSDDDAPSA